ncbi:MAG: DUF2066 domain-containing protein [Halioglobus sp.]|nr:DUF2066 domain-containing protein [Halioglobus sp.]
MAKVLAGLMIVLLAVSGAARGEVVRDLYAATVPVEDRGGAALTGAAGLALAQVLVKVSGSREVLREPSIKEALRNARREVQQYAYLPPAGEDERRRVRMEFDGTAVTELVLAAGVPIWTANRPAVLVWLVLEGASGKYFATAETAPQVVSALREVFAERGLPLRLPLYDLGDTAAISPQDVWRLDTTALADASARYDAEHVVGARLATSADGAWRGDWAYLDGSQRRDLAIQGSSTRDYLRQGVAAIADRLAARYAVVASDSDATNVMVRVSGVEEYADFATIVSWLQELEVVQRAAVTRIAGDRLELLLRARADASDLATLITLNDRLQPTTPAITGTALEYQWLR